MRATRLQLLAKEGSLDVLRYLQEKPGGSLSDLIEVFSEYYDADYISELIDQLEGIWFIQKVRSIDLLESQSEALELTLGCLCWVCTWFLALSSLRLRRVARLSD